MAIYNCNALKKTYERGKMSFCCAAQWFAETSYVQSYGSANPPLYLVNEGSLGFWMKNYSQGPPMR
jgi:hypothetical protein